LAPARREAAIASLQASELLCCIFYVLRVSRPFRLTKEGPDHLLPVVHTQTSCTRIGRVACQFNSLRGEEGEMGRRGGATKQH